MPWPPPIPPATRTNATAELDAHPADHNAISAALTELVNRAGPSASTELGYAEQVAAQSSITATVDLTGLAVTFTLTTQRKVWLEASAWYSKGSPDTSCTVYVQIATAANVEQVGGGGYMVAPGQGRFTVARRVTLAAGTYTFKARGSTAAGFLNTLSSAAEPSWMRAVDLGPG